MTFLFHLLASAPQTAATDFNSRFQAKMLNIVWFLAPQLHDDYRFRMVIGDQMINQENDLKS